MGITAEEALAQLDGSKPKSLTADEALAQLDAGAPKGYTRGEQVSELGREFVRGAGNVNADLVDIAGNMAQYPIAAYENLGGAALESLSDITGIGDYEDPLAGKRSLNPLKLWDRAIERNEESGTDWVGKMLKEKVAEDFAPQIEEGASGEGFERWRTGARIGGESANPLTFVAGWPNAIRGTVGAMGLGTAGQEVGGDMGELGGTILGDFLGTGFLRNPKTSIENLAKLTGKFKNAYRDVRNFLPGGTPLNVVDNASMDDLAKAVDIIKLNATVPRDIAILTDPVQKKAAIEAFNTKLEKDIIDAIDAGELGSLGQITDNAGIENYVRTLREGATNGGSAQARLSAQAQDQTNMRLTDEVNANIDEVSKTGRAEEAMDAPQEALREAKRVAREEAYTAGKSAEDAGDTILTQAVDAQSQAVKDRNLSAIQKSVAPNQTVPTRIGDEGVSDLAEGYQRAYTDAWEDASHLKPTVTRGMKEELDTLSKQVDKKDMLALDNLGKNIEKLSQGVTPPKMQALDHAFAKAIKSADGALAERLTSMRANFRAGLPDGVKSELAAIDAQYGKYLTVKKAATAANERAGVFKNSELATASRGVNSTTKPLQDVYVPGLEEDIALKSRLGEATVAEKAARKQADVLRKGAEVEINALDRTPAGKLAATDAGGVDEVIKTIARGGTTKNRSKALTELLDSVKNNPQGKKDIKRAFAKMFRNTFDADGGLNMKGKEDFDKMRKVYEDSGMFNKAELENFDKAIKEGQKLYMDTGKLPVQLPEGAQPLAETLAALVGAKIGAFAFGSPLIGAALGRKATTKMLKAISSERLNDLAYELMVKPEKFGELIPKLKQVNLTQKEFDSILGEMFNIMRAPAVAGREAGETEENN